MKPATKADKRETFNNMANHIVHETRMKPANKAGKTDISSN